MSGDRLARTILMDDDDQSTNPTLSAEQLALLGERGYERSLADGEVLYRAGEPYENFYVVLEGHVLIIDGDTNDGRVLAELGPGKFLGEYGVLVGGLGLMTNAANGCSRVLCLPIPELSRLVASHAVISELILRAFLLRRAILVGRGLGVKVFGDPRDSVSRSILDYLARNRVPHNLIETDETSLTTLDAFAVTVRDLPLVALGGRVLRCPTVAAVAAMLGLSSRTRSSDVLDLLVLGAGPAGLAAAVYAGSEGLSTALVDRTAPGGQAGTSSRIENYLGFPAGISGAELTARAELQCAKFGAAFRCPAEAVSLGADNALHVVELAGGEQLGARSVVIATGAQYRGLNLPRLMELQGVGVYYAATQFEAAASRDAEVAIVGAGNSAGQAAIFLADHSRLVRLIFRGASLSESMSSYLADRITSHQRIELLPESEVTELHGSDRLDAITVRGPNADSVKVGSTGLFVFTGAEPHTAWLGPRVALDRHGFVLTGQDVEATNGHMPSRLETSVAGIFAVGDVRSTSTKRVAAAVGEGAMAVAFVHEYLRRTSA